MRKSTPEDIIVLEEVSVLFPSRRAMSQENVSIGAIFDTIRKKRLCVITNAPLWTSIDSHMRSMGNILIETLRIDKTQGVVVSKVFKLQTNPAMGKTYTHTFVNRGRDVNFIYTKMPNLQRWAEYELQKDKFMDELYETLQYKVQKKKDKNDEELGRKRKQIDVKQLDELDLVIHSRINVNNERVVEVAKDLGLHRQTIYNRLAKIDKKGGIIKDIT